MPVRSSWAPVQASGPSQACCLGQGVEPLYAGAGPGVARRAVFLPMGNMAGWPLGGRASRCHDLHCEERSHMQHGEFPKSGSRRGPVWMFFTRVAQANSSPVFGLQVTLDGLHNVAGRGQTFFFASACRILFSKAGPST